MNACHCLTAGSLSGFYPELDYLAETAQTLPGCLGARLTGAGFGGCTVNLVQKSASAGFVTTLAEKYYQSTGLTLKATICKASAGHHVVPLR